MAERKTTPNIMGELLGGKPPLVEQQDKPKQQRASAPLQHDAVTPVRLQDSNSKPIKATYYFSPDTIEAIDDAWMQLRRLAGPERSSVSKSLIVETAIQMALKEFERNGGKSQLASITVTQHRSLIQT